MKKNFEKYNSSMYFNSDKDLSPVTKISIGIALDYSKALSEDKAEKKPFCFSFPSKQYSSIWLSAGILLKNYSDDFCGTVDKHFHALNLHQGDKVEIFNTIAQFEYLCNGLPVIKFKEESCLFTLSKGMLQYINRVDNNRTLNKFSLYRKKRDAQKKKIDAISKILGADTLINSSLLTSKIILITGRNSSGNFREYMKKQIIYGETIDKILNINNNLEIKASLNSYVDINSQEHKNKFLNFKKELEIVAENADDDILNKTLRNLKDLIGEDGIPSEGFDDLFKELVANYKEKSEDIDVLENLYPGAHKEKVDLKNIKAVVINDIKQVQEFPDTIEKFLKNHVPVFVITDRYPDKQQLDFLRTFIESNDFYRLNWNKTKINGLLGINSASMGFLDNDFWEICLRFARQNITIEVSEGNRIDELMPEIRRKLKDFPAYERLRKSYYDNLESAFCSIKNSEKAGENTCELLSPFFQVFNDVKTYINPELKALIEEIVNEILFRIQNEVVNSKSINNFNDCVFKQSFRINNKNYYIPESIHYNDNNFFKAEKITFPGFPYDEPRKHFLNDAVCNGFIPTVNIKCWPKEASLTKGYLDRRIFAGYFTDKLPEGIEFPEEYLLKSDEEIKKEIFDSLIIKQINENPEEIKIDSQESDLLDLKRGKYQSSAENGNDIKTNPVDCCVVLFEDDCYLFLPVNNHSKLLVGWQDDEQDRFLVKRLKSNEIEIGQLFFDYNFYVDLPTIMKLNGFSIEEANKKTVELYEWRNVLETLYGECNNDIKKLTTLLIQTKQKNNDLLGKSSPNAHNIKRWLTDEEILSPHLENQSLIFTAAGRYNYGEVREIFKLRNEIRGMITSLSAAVKKDIEEKYSRKKEFTERSFEYKKQNVNISCLIHKITGIDWDLINVEYSRTRKVICD